MADNKTEQAQSAILEKAQEVLLQKEKTKQLEMQLGADQAKREHELKLLAAQTAAQAAAAAAATTSVQNDMMKQMIAALQASK